MSTTTKQRGVDENLKEEMADMVGATDGDVVYGKVRRVERRGGRIYVTVWLPTDETIKTSFSYPKPPFDDWKFTRFAKAYGHGLVDLDGLVGSEVPVRYNGDWNVVVPEKKKNKTERTKQLLSPKVYTGTEDTGDLIFLLGMWPMIVPAFTAIFIFGDNSRARDTVKGLQMAAFLTAFWFALIFFFLFLVVS